MAARKGLGLTIKGSLVTESWEDKESGERKSQVSDLATQLHHGSKAASDTRDQATR